MMNYHFNKCLFVRSGGCDLLSDSDLWFQRMVHNVYTVDVGGCDWAGPHTLLSGAAGPQPTVLSYTRYLITPVYHWTFCLLGLLLYSEGIRHWQSSPLYVRKYP